MTIAPTRVVSGKPAYERRKPEATVFHQVVRDNLRTLYAAAEDGFAAPLPGFVRNELEGFIDCGVLARGFAVIACQECREQKVVGFSCKGRGFCTSCGGRRMTSTAADLVDHVLPDVPLRQLVLTLPFELRARVAYDGELLGAVTRTFVDSVLGWYQRQMRARAVPGGKSGAVTVVQRVNSDLRLSPHLHSLFLDGVFAEDEGGELVFHPLPFLTNDDVGDVLQIARARTLALLRRKGVIEDDSVTRDAELADSEPALAALAAASVTGCPPVRPFAVETRSSSAPTRSCSTPRPCARRREASRFTPLRRQRRATPREEKPCASTCCVRRSPTSASSSSATTSSASC